MKSEFISTCFWFCWAQEYATLIAGHNSTLQMNCDSIVFNHPPGAGADAGVRKGTDRAAGRRSFPNDFGWCVPHYTTNVSEQIFIVKVICM